MLEEGVASESYLWMNLVMSIVYDEQQLHLADCHWIHEVTDGVRQHQQSQPQREQWREAIENNDHLLRLLHSLHRRG